MENTLYINHIKDVIQNKYPSWKPNVLPTKNSLILQMHKNISANRSIKTVRYNSVKMMAHRWVNSLLVFCVLKILCGTQTVNAQMIIQFHYNLFNPMMIDGTGYGGQSVGTNILLNKFGFDFDYGFTRKKRKDRYNYFNPKVKYQFSDKQKGREAYAYHYLTLGFNHFTAIKNSTFWGRSTDLRPPYWDSTETAKTYDNYLVLAETQSNMLELGYEKVTLLTD